MIKMFRNSLLSKTLQVLLIGYFLISSLSLSHNLSRISATNTDVHKKDNVLLAVFKKFVKCSNNTEEMEDSDSESGYSSNKVKLTADYLMPAQSGFILYNCNAGAVERLYSSHSILNGILYNKIHLPPPERMFL